MNFSRDFPIIECGEMAQDLRLVDRAFGSSLQSDTESLCAQMLGGKDHTQKGESYDADCPVPAADAPRLAMGKDQELRDIVELLRRVHRATASNTDVRAYKICALPDAALPGIRALRSSKSKMAKMHNFATALDIVADSGEVQLFGKSSSESEFRRLDVDLSEFERHGWKRAIFGTPRLRERRLCNQVRPKSGRGARKIDRPSWLTAGSGPCGGSLELGEAPRIPTILL